MGRKSSKSSKTYQQDKVLTIFMYPCEYSYYKQIESTIW